MKTQPRSERAPRVVEEPLVVVSVVVLDEPVVASLRPRLVPVELRPVVMSDPLVLLPVVPLPIVLLPVVPLPIVLLPVVPDAPLPVELPAAPVVLLPLDPVALEPLPMEPLPMDPLPMDPLPVVLLPVALLPVEPLFFIEPLVPGAGFEGVDGPVELDVVLLVLPPSLPAEPLPAEPPELPPDPPPACANARPAAMARAADTATIACLFMRRLL